MSKNIILLCPTCQEGRYIEVYPSKTDPTGYTIYCRRCEEGCVSPLVVEETAKRAGEGGR